MTDIHTQGLSKEERMHSRALIETLFNGGISRAVTVYPLRAVYMPTEAGSQMLISVPKRLFKRAVKRNRVKRLVREAYRRNKQLLGDRQVAVAFIWISDKLASAHMVEERVRKILQRVSEGTQKAAQKPAGQPADEKEEI